MITESPRLIVIDNFNSCVDCHYWGRAQLGVAVAIDPTIKKVIGTWFQG